MCVGHRKRCGQVAPGVAKALGKLIVDDPDCFLSYFGLPGDRDLSDDHKSHFFTAFIMLQFTKQARITKLKIHIFVVSVIFCSVWQPL